MMGNTVMRDLLEGATTMRGRAVGTVSVLGDREITIYAVRPVATLLAATPQIGRAHV